QPATSIGFQPYPKTYIQNNSFLQQYLLTQLIRVLVFLQQVYSSNQYSSWLISQTLPKRTCLPIFHKTHAPLPLAMSLAFFRYNYNSTHMLKRQLSHFQFHRVGRRLTYSLCKLSSLRKAL